jgi:hypothetical protein
LCRSKLIGCQHETVAHHDPATIQFLLDSQASEIQEATRREQELRDMVIALELTVTERMPPVLVVYNFGVPMI